MNNKPEDGRGRQETVMCGLLTLLVGAAGYGDALDMMSQWKRDE